MTQQAIGFHTPSSSPVVRIDSATRRHEKRLARMANAGSSVMPDRPIWEQFQRIGGALTPTQLSHILREADTGYTRRLMDLGNEARQKDGHLSAVLSQSEESLAGLDWEIQTKPKAKKKERDVAEWVEGYLRNEIIEPLTTLIAYLAGAPYFGFDVNEIAWARDAKRRLVPIDFEHREHRRFRFRQSDAKLVWQDPGMPEEGVDFREEFPNRFIVAQPRITGDAPMREGFIRVLLWAALFRNWTITDWLRTGEISWKPWRTGVYKKGASDEDRENLEAALEKLSSTGAGVFAETTDLKVHWPQGGGGQRLGHSELFNVVAQEMSKVVLGQTETTQSSTSSGYAQGKVHYAVRENILKARSKHIAAVITRDLVRPMVELNFGYGIAIPRFVFVTKVPADLKEFGAGVKALTDSGLRVSSKWVRSTAGMPDPEEDEETIGGAPEVAPEPADPAAGGSDGGGEGDDDGSPDPGASGDNPDTAEDGEAPAAEQSTGAKKTKAPASRRKRRKEAS